MNPLKGAHILVTRPAHQAENICRLITQQGGIAIRFPALEIVAANSCGNTKDLLAKLDGKQWLVFISVNAVNFALQANGGKIERNKQWRIAAIGQATAQALEIAGLPVDLIPEKGYDSEVLLLAMANIKKGQRCLIVRGEGGREELADGLRKKGVEVEYWEIYKRVIPDIDKAPVRSLLTQNKLDFITITSAEALQNLLFMLGEEYYKSLINIPLVVISDRIGKCAAKMGFSRIAVADNPSDAAILGAVTTIINGESGRSE